MDSIIYELNGQEIKKYLREAASSVVTSFDTELAEKFNSGGFFAVAPKNLTAERLNEFSEGGLTPPGKEIKQNEYRLVEKLTLERDFAEAIFEALQKWPGSAVAGFDAASSVSASKSGVLDLTAKPFGILQKTNPDIDEIFKFTKEFSTAWTNIIMIIKDPQTVKNLVTLATNIIVFAVAAYDGESFVFWSRRLFKSIFTKKDGTQRIMSVEARNLEDAIDKLIALKRPDENMNTPVEQ